MRGVSGSPGRQSPLLGVPVYIPTSIRPSSHGGEPRPFANAARIVLTLVRPAPPPKWQSRVQRQHALRRCRRGTTSASCGVESATFGANVITVSTGASRERRERWQVFS